MENPLNCTIVGLALLLLLCVGGSARGQDGQEDADGDGGSAAFEVPAMWECTAPLIAPEERDTDPSRAQKDPTVVFFEGKWHVFMTVIEENGRRYFKAYIADGLDGAWTPIADTAEKPFASWQNVRPAAGVEAWTDNISHGELIRDGHDQNLIVDPSNLRFIFQGMWDKDKAGKGYGAFQWRIGMLTPVAATAP